MSIEIIEKHFQELKKFLDSLGVNTITRAHKQVNNLKNRNTQLEQYQTEVCRLLNVDNIGNALKRLKSLTNATSLPPEFQQEPAIWITGSTEFSRMDYKVARKEYRALLPMLLAVYNDIVAETNTIAREETLSAFRECFERSSPGTLYAHCRNYLFDSDIVIENNTNDDDNTTVEPLTSDLLDCLNELNNIDYGIKKHS
jgi:FtsZ-binding cell division protein ZapB